MSRGAPPTVAVVVVTHNSGRFIEACLASVPGAFDRGERIEVVVADNVSSDDTLERVRAVAPIATIVETGGNLGYAAAINRAINVAHRAAVTDAIFVLNPDIVLDPGAGSELLAAVTEPGTDAGIAVPRVREPDGTIFATLRRRPTITRALGEALLGGRRAGRSPRLGELVPPGPAYEHRTDADWATGACWMISAACAAAVGAWDERFWLYSEETDYARRAQDAGWRLVLVPEAEILHVGGESNTDPRLWTVLTTNRVRAYAKHHGPGATTGFWAAVVVNELLRSPRHATHQAALRALLAGPAALAATYETAAGPRPVSRSNTDT